MRVLPRTARREARRWLRSRGIYADLARGRLRACCCEAWDHYLGWCVLIVAAGWLLAGHLDGVPRLGLIPVPEDPTEVATLLQAWTQTAATLVGLLLPLAVLLAGWLGSRAQLALAFGPENARRPAELVAYSLLAIFGLGATAAMARMRPEGSVWLADAVLLAAVLAVALMLRVGAFAWRVLRLVDERYAEAVLLDRFDRTLRASLHDSLMIQLGNAVVSGECERLGLGYMHGLGRDTTDPGLIRSSRTGYVADVYLDRLAPLEILTKPFP